jgi:hypothetical protein
MTSPYVSLDINTLDYSNTDIHDFIIETKRKTRVFNLCMIFSLVFFGTDMFLYYVWKNDILNKCDKYITNFCVVNIMYCLIVMIGILIQAANIHKINYIRFRKISYILIVMFGVVFSIVGNIYVTHSDTTRCSVNITDVRFNYIILFSTVLTPFFMTINA